MTDLPLAARVFDALVQAPSHGGWRPFQSGALIAATLGVTRGAVWKAADHLRQLGVPVEALPRQGYRLAMDCTALSKQAILDALPATLRSSLRSGDCAWQLASTNASLLAQGALQPGQWDFLTAEVQTAGRGRRGRSWLAPPGATLCLSWSWCFEALPAQAGALGLAIGVTALRALTGLGITGVQLKWPNDLVTAQGKLGGILIEMRTEAGGPVHVVCGIGLNLSLPQAIREAIAATGNQATDLASLDCPLPGRSALAAALLHQGVTGLGVFGREGLAPFHPAFTAADALVGQPVVAQGATSQRVGQACGIDPDGALLLQTREGLQRVFSADVSVRPASAAGGE